MLPVSEAEAGGGGRRGRERGGGRKLLFSVMRYGVRFSTAKQGTNSGFRKNENSLLRYDFSKPSLSRQKASQYIFDIA